MTKLFTYDDCPLPLAPKTLRVLVSRGKLKSSRLNGRVVFTEEQIQEFIDANLEPNAKPGTGHAGPGRGKR